MGDLRGGSLSIVSSETKIRHYVKLPCRRSALRVGASKIAEKYAGTVGASGVHWYGQDRTGTLAGSALKTRTSSKLHAVVRDYTYARGASADGA